MNDPEEFDSNEADRLTEKAEKQYPRFIGPSPSIRIRDARPQTPAQFDESRSDEQSPADTPPPQRALTPASPAKAAPPSTLQRAVNMFRAALPYVQRVLPLLDGNVGTAVSNILAPRTQTPPPVDLAPIQSGLTDLQLQHRELRNRIVEQNTALKKVEDQLQMVREATDRNTLEQQELLGDLKSVGKKVNLFAWIALSLLLLSLVMNGYLVFHFWRVFH